MNYNPRTTAPASSNVFFQGKPYTGSSSSKGQCTWYAMGRSSELLGAQANNWSGYPSIDNPMLTRTGYPNAKEWIKYANWKTGTTPKLGAIAVWNGTAGHVAVVEKIDGDDIYISDYNKIASKTFWYGKIDVNTYNGKGNFLGYIYNPNEYSSEDLPDPVEKNSNKDQIYVSASNCRIRTDADINASILGYAAIGYYNVLNTKENDGYTWYKIDKNCYIAGVDSVVYYEKGSTDATKIKELETEITTLTKENKTLSEKIEKLQSKISGAIKELS